MADVEWCDGGRSMYRVGQSVVANFVCVSRSLMFGWMHRIRGDWRDFYRYGINVDSLKK